MSAAKTQCPKCSGEMVQGFIVDLNLAGRLVSSWAEGAPQKAAFSGTKRPTEQWLPVGTFRCSGCGFLESYAQQAFAAK